MLTKLYHDRQLYNTLIPPYKLAPVFHALMDPYIIPHQTSIVDIGFQLSEEARVRQWNNLVFNTDLITVAYVSCAVMQI